MTAFHDKWTTLCFTYVINSFKPHLLFFFNMKLNKFNLYIEGKQEEKKKTSLHLVISGRVAVYKHGFHS